jgi:hypothetical protein
MLTPRRLLCNLHLMQNKVVKTEDTNATEHVSPISYD